MGRFIARRAPPQHSPCRLNPLPVHHLAWVVAVAAGLSNRPVDVIACDRPTNQPAVGGSVDSKWTRYRRPRLLGIRSDDLQVRLRPKCKQGVTSTESYVAPTSLRPNTEVFLEVVDRSDEVGSGIDEMVNQHLNLNSIQLMHTNLWPGGRFQ